MWCHALHRLEDDDLVEDNLRSKIIRGSTQGVCAAIADDFCKPKVSHLDEAFRVQ